MRAWWHRQSETVQCALFWTSIFCALAVAGLLVGLMT